MTEEEQKAILEKHADTIDYVSDNAEPHLIRETAVEPAFLAGYEAGVASSRGDRALLESVAFALSDGCFCDDNPLCACCDALSKVREHLGPEISVNLPEPTSA